MTNVAQMINDILEREGGYVNHPDDGGGATNFGITQKTLSDYLGREVTVQEVKDMPVALAGEIYKRNYFMAPGIDTLPGSIQPFVFDCAVNHGPRRAIKFVQSVCNQAGYDPALVEDGATGPNTRRAAKWTEEEMDKMFLRALIEERRNFYLTIVEARPSQRVFLDGWLNRISEFEQEVA